MIILAGANGDLGGRIAAELLKQNVKVRALLRPETSAEKKEKLKSLGGEVYAVNFNDSKALTVACTGGSVVVSALAGLRDTIVDTQTQLLNMSFANALTPPILKSRLF